MREFIAEYFEHSPAFAPVAPVARQLAWRSWPSQAAYYSGLNGLGAPVQFGEHEPTLSYELHIGATRQVPTRYALWHDYFNALIWCRFPQAKTQLNVLHRSHWVANDSVDRTEIMQRTPVRDGLTLLDESGALVICDDEQLLQLLRSMQWPELFVAQRKRVQAHMRVLVFGHGLLEKFLQPYIGMTAQALLLCASAETIKMPLPSLCEWADSALAEKLRAAGKLMPAELFPLPMLGLPGWWPANEDATFYDNERYFRRSRHRQPSA